MYPSAFSPRMAMAIDCSRVDLPDPFSPLRTISGAARSTSIGMWKFRLGKTGWPRIFKYIGHQDSRGGGWIGNAGLRLRAWHRGLLTHASRLGIRADARRLPP